MREGKLFIKAKDRGGTYDNLSALLTPPPAKRHTTVDYRERDGEEADVSDVRFEARDISLRLAMITDNEQEFRTKYKGFIEILRSGLLNVRVSEIGKTYKLYYLSCPGTVMKTRLRTTGRLAAIWTVKFREPKPDF